MFTSTDRAPRGAAASATLEVERDLADSARAPGVSSAATVSGPTAARYGEDRWRSWKRFSAATVGRVERRRPAAAAAVEIAPESEAGPQRSRPAVRARPGAG
jgi:hypothetical protein